MIFSFLKSLDKWLIVAILFLSIFGIWVMSSVSVYKSYTDRVSSISKYFCQENFPSETLESCSETKGVEYAKIYCTENNCNDKYLKKKILHVFLAFFAFLIALFFPLKILKQLSLPLFVLAFILLIYVLIRPAEGNFSAKSWISLPVLGSFQPAELMKIAFVFYFSSWMEKKESVIKTFNSGFVPFLILVSIATFPVMMQPDFGSTFVLGAIAASIFFIAGGATRHFLIAFGLTIVSGIIASMIFAHVRDRFRTFFNPELADRDTRYQLDQSFLSIGNGRFFGAGENTLSYGFLPEIEGDMVFAATAEQVGFVGILFVLAAYAVITIRGILIAKKVKGRFPMLVATGISAWFGIQSLINMMVVTGLFPLTGITLPFLSNGGTSLMVTLGSLGILVKISSYAHERTYQSRSSSSRRRNRRTYFSTTSNS